MTIHVARSFRAAARLARLARSILAETFLHPCCTSYIAADGRVIGRSGRGA